MERVWVSEIICSERVRVKIEQKHGVEKWRVDDACLVGRYRSARREYDPERGERLVMRGIDREGRAIMALLKPVNRADGTYRLVTARMDAR